MFSRVMMFMVLSAMLAGLAYAGGNVTIASYNREEIKVKVSVDNKGGWVGCSFYTSQGRIDTEARQVVGEDALVFKIPEGAYKCEVALWRQRWDSGKGPDPKNAWGKINGYYLWEELSRDRVNFSR